MITDDVCSLPAVSTNHIFWYIHVCYTCVSTESYLLLGQHMHIRTHAFLPTTWLLMMFVHYPPFPQITSSDTYTCFSTNHIFSWKLYLIDSQLFTLKSDTRFVGCESHDPTMPLLTVLLGRHMPLFQLWNFPAIPARHVFPWKKKRHPAGAGIITCEFTVTCEPKRHCTWENTMKVNPRNVAGFLRHAFSMKDARNVEAVGRESFKFTITLNARRFFFLRKHTESGRVPATHVLVEKRYGIRERWVAGHMNLQSQGTQDAFYLKKGIWGGLVERAFFTEKHTSQRAWVIRGIYLYLYIYIYNQNEGQPHSTRENTKISPGLAGVAYKFTVKMKARRILHEKTQWFLRGRRELHINLQGKESRGAFYTRKHNDFSGVGCGGRRGCILIRNRDGADNVQVKSKTDLRILKTKGWGGAANHSNGRGHNRDRVRGHNWVRIRRYNRGTSPTKRPSWSHSQVTHLFWTLWCLTCWPRSDGFSGHNTFSGASLLRNTQPFSGHHDTPQMPMTCVIRWKCQGSSAWVGWNPYQFTAVSVWKEDEFRIIRENGFKKLGSIHTFTLQTGGINFLLYSA